MYLTSRLEKISFNHNVGYDNIIETSNTNMVFCRSLMSFLHSLFMEMFKKST